jgi:hypothetical protein
MRLRSVVVRVGASFDTTLAGSKNERLTVSRIQASSRIPTVVVDRHSSDDVVGDWDDPSFSGGSIQ